MWIRSQNKEELIDVGCVFVRKHVDDYNIITAFEDAVFVLGMYKKKSTALEVVDTIQLRIVQSYLHKRHKPTRCLANAEDVVFEMPKDVPDVA